MVIVHSYVSFPESIFYICIHTIQESSSNTSYRAVNHRILETNPMWIPSGNVKVAIEAMASFNHFYIIRRFSQPEWWFSSSLRKRVPEVTHLRNTGGSSWNTRSFTIIDPAPPQPGPHVQAQNDADWPACMGLAMGVRQPVTWLSVKWIIYQWFSEWFS